MCQRLLKLPDRDDMGIDKIEIDPEHLRIRKTILQLQQKIYKIQWVRLCD